MKKDLLKQAEKLQKELDILKEKINNSNKIDLFTITTYSEVCKQLEEKEESCLYKKIKQIEKLFNGDWIKDWSNRSQKKYYPYFEYSSGGWSFCVVRVCGYYSPGEPAFYKDEKTVKYIVSQREFMDIYKEYLNN